MDLGVLVGMVGMSLQVPLTGKISASQKWTSVVTNSGADVRAAALLWKLDRAHHSTNRLMGPYLILGSFVASLVICLQMPSMNIAGYTKRVTATAIIFLAYCLGNIIGPHAFLGSEAPIYQTGVKVIIACCAGQIILAIGLRILLISRNKKRDSLDLPELDVADEILEDQTDFKNLRFRYVY